MAQFKTIENQKNKAIKDSPEKASLESTLFQPLNMNNYRQDKSH